MEPAVYVLCTMYMIPLYHSNSFEIDAFNVKRITYILHVSLLCFEIEENSLIVELVNVTIQRYYKYILPFRSYLRRIIQTERVT